MTGSLSSAVAKYAEATTFDALPAAVRTRAAQIVLDEMASACFGMRRPAGKLAARHVASSGGPPESRVLGTTLRVCAPYAALANGTAGHADEIDGAHVVGGHPGATLVHAAVAMAERQRASGADLLTAVVLGYDIGIRLIAACGGLFDMKDRLRLHSDFLHAVAAAVACGRLLGLDPDRLCHAMALATFSANGLCSLFQERRHISKAFCNGQYASAGVQAALLAETGFEGCDDVLGERYGLLDAWGVEGGAETLVRGLGEEFAVMGANMKFVRAGYPIHAVVEAATTLVDRHGIAPEALAAVRVGMPSRAMRVVDNRAMHDICVQDMLSVALVRGGLDLRETYFPQILDDPLFRAVRERIDVDVDPGLEAEQPNGRGAVVTLVTTDGMAVTHRVDHPRGHSLRGGATWDDLTAKWRSALPDVDELDDVGALAAAFASSRPCIAEKN